MRLPAKFLSLAVILITAVYAKADTLNFTLTGDGSTFTFSLPSNPSPDSDTLGTSFTLLNILITDTNGGPSTSFSSAITFASLGHGGGLMFTVPTPPPPTNFDLTGLQLYTGMESSPTFGPTTTPFVLSTPKGDGDFTLRIDGDAPTVPEPSSIVLLTTGLVAITGVRRRL